MTIIMTKKEETYDVRDHLYYDDMPFYKMYLEVNEKYKELFKRYLFETTQLRLAVMDRDNQIILLKGDLAFIQTKISLIKKN